jgi:hypothetical protein
MATRSPEDEPGGTIHHLDLSGRAAAEEESPAAPAIPSFESLRGPRRRTAVDLLVPEAPRPSGPAPAGGQRHAEYADLLRLGGRAVRAVAGVPVRVAGWPLRCVRRLLGGRPG